MPVMLIAFIVMMAFAAFMPSKREEASADRDAQAAVPAGQLRTWHAAAVRACMATGSPCGQGTIPATGPSGVIGQLPATFAGAPAFNTNRFSSYFDGSVVFSFYNGSDSRRPNEAAAQASAALVAISSPDSRASVGYYDRGQGMFFPGSYTVQMTGPNGGTYDLTQAPGSVSTNPGAYYGIVPRIAPMAATRVKFN